ncbi:MAG: hypothetical protein AAF352_04750, partial [Pseudomonadota bacterium]
MARFHEATINYENALQNPILAEDENYQWIGKFNLAACYHMQNMLPKSLALYQELYTQMSGPYAQSLIWQLQSSLAIEYSAKGKHKEALRLSRHAQDHPQADYKVFTNAVSVNFAAGNIEQAWHLYEKRSLSPQARPFRSAFLPEQLWTGGDLKGKHLLICQEQGIGDKILFASLLPALKQYNPKAISLTADPRLAQLLERSFRNVTIIPATQDDEHHDMQKRFGADLAVLMGSLPLYLRLFLPDGATLQKGPFLTPDAGRVQAYKRELRASFGDKRTIGLAWQTPQAIRYHATVPVIKLVEVLPKDNVQLINLQYDFSERLVDGVSVVDQIAACHAETGVDVATLPNLDLVEDIDNLAALLCALDDVVVCGNFNGDLACALREDTHIILSPLHHWRWRHKDGQHGFYPHAHIYYRGYDDTDWGPALQQLQRAFAPEENEENRQKPKKKTPKSKKTRKIAAIITRPYLCRFHWHGWLAKNKITILDVATLHDHDASILITDDPEIAWQCVTRARACAVIKTQRFSQTDHDWPDWLPVIADSQPQSAADLMAMLQVINPEQSSGHTINAIVQQADHLRETMRFAEAITAYEEACRSMTQDDTLLWIVQFNLAFCYCQMGQMPACDALYETLLSNLAPQGGYLWQLQTSLALGLSARAEHAQAIALQEKAEQNAPNIDKVATNGVNIFMGAGDFARAWQVLKRRTQSPRLQKIITDIPPKKLWNGQALDGKNLLILQEQGLGDKILFS